MLSKNVVIYLREEMWNGLTGLPFFTSALASTTLHLRRQHFRLLQYPNICGKKGNAGLLTFSPFPTMF